MSSSLDYPSLKQDPGAPGHPADAAPPADPPFDGRSPKTDWPWWSGPLALACGLVLALFGALIVDIVAAIFGVNVTANNLPPGLEIADTVAQDALFVLSAVLIAGMAGRRVRPWQFGLRTTRALRAAWMIAVLYVSFLVFSALWETLLNLQGKEKLLDQLGANENTALLIASATLTCVIAPACEEFLFRGYIFTALRNWRGVWPAAVLTGLLFGAVHVESAPIAYLAPLAFLGFGLCVLYWRTGSLLPCIAAHSLNNSIAFGTLEDWRWSTVLLLAAIALGVLGLIAVLLRRLGLLARGPTAAPSLA